MRDFYYKEHLENIYDDHSTYNHVGDETILEDITHATSDTDNDEQTKMLDDVHMEQDANNTDNGNQGSDI